MSTPQVHRPLLLSMPRTELNRLCKMFGPVLNLEGCTDRTGAPLVGSQLLLAIAGRESTFGSDLKPRFEPSYFVDGANWKRSPEVQECVEKYGRAGACSYGPLQVLAVNCHGYTPYELGADPETAMEAAVGFFNRYVIKFRQARTLECMCDTWNTGNWRDQNVPTDYIADVWHKYLSEVIG